MGHLLTEHNRLDWGRPCLCKGLSVLRLLLSDMAQDKDAKLFSLPLLFSAAYKHMPLNTATLTAMLVERCGMRDTGSSPIFKGYPWDASLIFRGVLHEHKILDGLITTNGADASVRYALPKTTLCKKRARGPRSKVPVNIDLTNA
jgi:hypothetical protein